ncbi:hypothetical protein ACI65C_007930 [Semiaphis heraclei]
MLNTADLFVCIFLFVLLEQLDGFPISRLPCNRDDLSRSTSVQPSDLSDRFRTEFPETRPHKHDWSSSTSPQLLQMTCRHKRVQTSNGLTPTPAQRMYSWSGKKETRKAILPSTQPSPTDNEISFSSSSDEKGTSKVSHSFRRPSTTDYKEIISSSPSSNKESVKFLMTTSFAMRMQSNFRLSKEKESPMILFDQNGKMYTNVYPPIWHQNNENKQKANDVDSGRKYLPKWLVIGTKKT